MIGGTKEVRENGRTPR